MRLPPTGANGLESRDWEGFKQDVDDFFTDLFSPVCKKFPKTLGCPKSEPELEPTPPVVVPNPNPPNPPNPNPPGNPGQTPPGQAPPITTPVSNPVPTTPVANPPPAATTAPAPVIPAPQPTQAPGNGNDGNGNDGGNGSNDGNGNGSGGGNGGDGSTDPGSEGSNPSPTQGGGGGGGGSEPQPTTTRAGQGNGRPQNLGGNVLLVGSNTASGPRPTSFADSQSGVTDGLGSDGHDDPAPEPIFNNDADGPGPGRVLIDNDSGSQSSTPKPTGSYNDGLNNDNESGSTSNNGGGLDGGGISGGDGGSGSTNPENGNAAASPLPGIIGAVVALVVLFLILFALLYKYRRTRRVQSFLIRFTPLKIAAYSKLDRKRSSMGSELLFGCRGEQEPYTDEKRPWSTNYGSMDNAPAVTQPNRVAARRSCTTELPPRLELDISLANSVRSASPTSQFEPSPLSPSYPNMRTPPPARHSPRTSQDSTGGISIASSGVFNPSMITWPMPPSMTNSMIGSPPGTSHTANTTETYDTGPIIVGRSTPTRYKPVLPAQPSNWKKPQDWDV